MFFFLLLLLYTILNGTQDSSSVVYYRYWWKVREAVVNLGFHDLQNLRIVTMSLQSLVAVLLGNMQNEIVVTCKGLDYCCWQPKFQVNKDSPYIVTSLSSPRDSVQPLLPFLSWPLQTEWTNLSQLDCYLLSYCMCVIIMYFTAYKYVLKYNCQEDKIEKWIRLWFKNPEVSGSNLKLDRWLLYFLFFCAIKSMDRKNLLEKKLKSGT